MAKIKYYYDTESCKYERVKVSTWDIILNLLGFFALSLIIAIVIFWGYSNYFESPKEARLKKENEELLLYYDLLKKDLGSANEMLASLQERDDNLYRLIFEAEPIPSTIRRAGIGGVNRYRKLMEGNLEREKLVIDTYKKIDKLKKQMYIQTKSYDELMEIAKNKEKFRASIPAIQPISKRLKPRLSSGFGYRKDPFTRHRKLHAGIDFAIKKGTPIYATGDGKVITRKESIGGYGKLISIDHGFGFETRYAHLSGFNVKKGQKIKRGECIGYVGNSGRSTGPHLHYEVRKNGKAVDPVHYFYKDLSPSEYDEILRLAANENKAMETF